MEQRNAKNDELINMRRERMNIPSRAGTMSRARYDADGMPIMEMSDPRIQNRFGHILSGQYRERMQELDGHDLSVLPAPSWNGRQVDIHKDEMPVNKRRQPPRGKQGGKVDDPKNAVQVQKFIAPGLKGEESAILNDVNAWFGETSKGGRSDISGRLVPERPNDMNFDLSGYGSVPFDPLTQIKYRARRSHTGVDYRDLEERSRPAQPQYDDDESRYLANTYRHAAPAYDEKAMQDMARSMAEAMVKTVMQEHLDKQKGRKYFREVKYEFKNDPNSRLVEIDGKYFKMDLKPVKVKPTSK